METGLEQVTSILFLMMMCIIRLAAALSLTPVFAKQYIMGTGRNVVIFAMALPLFHVVYPTLPTTQLPLLILFVTICKEVIIGAMLGYLSGFIFYVTDSVGFIIDIQRGSSQAMTFDPIAGSQTSLLGSFLTQMIATLFFTMGGFLFFLGVIYKTYVVWPVFTFFPSFNVNFPAFMMSFADEIMEAVFCFSAPILIVLFLAEFGLGMISRFAPQLNVFFMAMPVKSWLSVFFLLFYFSLLGKLFHYHFFTQSKLSFFVDHFLK
ncbi:MAG: type III secretion system export apparatus subunit SctT [Puniceicoccales bacterium]|jgi:type III secretion protein T|nr:type III secretion system export apparatus subunit SctT [Puniceicoccales bacterium]MDR2371749.1 type III secretion system export apparatus subunit SctT [Puniceicoccales bacterium]